MFEIVKAIHKALKTESTTAFVIVIAVVFGLGGGVIGWLVDQGYKNSAAYKEEHKAIPGPLAEWQQTVSRRISWTVN